MKSTLDDRADLLCEDISRNKIFQHYSRSSISTHFQTGAIFSIGVGQEISSNIALVKIVGQADSSPSGLPITIRSP